MPWRMGRCSKQLLDPAQESLPNRSAVVRAQIAAVVLPLPRPVEQKAHGGRVLRAIIWKRSGNIREATRIAGFCGQLMSLVLIAFGIYMAIAPTFRAYFMGLWSVLVGVFLLVAANSVVRSTRDSVTVAQAMSPPVPVEPDLPITRFVDEVLPLHRHVTFPVAFNRRLLGILSLEDLKKIPREKWRGLRAREVMRTVNSQLFVPENATIESVNELLEANGADGTG